MEANVKCKFAPGDKVIAACQPNRIRTVVNVRYDDEYGYEVLVDGTSLYISEQNFIHATDRGRYTPVYLPDDPLWGYWKET